MIEERARVLCVDGENAEVVIEKQPACGACSAKSGCGTSLLSRWFPQRQLTLSLKNSVDAKTGDTVVLGMDETMLQRSSLLLYAVPLGGLLLGAILGERLFLFLGFSAELGAVLLGLLGVLTALVFVRQKSDSMVQGGEGAVRLLRVVQQSSYSVFGEIVIPETDQKEGFGTNR